MVDKAQVNAVLDTIIDPRTGRSIVAMGWIQSVHVSEGQIGVVMEVPGNLASGAAPLRSKAEKALADLAGVESAQVVLTAEREAKPQQQPSPAASKNDGPTGLDQVKALIAVGSGKGGVGKSTTTINLALSFGEPGFAGRCGGCRHLRSQCTNAFGPGR